MWVLSDSYDRYNDATVPLNLANGGSLKFFETMKNHNYQASISFSCNGPSMILNGKFGRLRTLDQ